MAENKASKAAGEAQEPLKKEKTYKVTCGTFNGVQPALCRGHDESRGRGGKKGNRGEKGKSRGFRAVKKM